MKDEVPDLRENGVLTLSDASWEKAKSRFDIIAPLAQASRIDRCSARDAADALGLSVRQVFALVKRFRTGEGLVTDMAPSRSSGGKGRSRLTPAIEQLIAEVIRSHYLKKQKLSTAAVYREIRRQALLKGLRPPALNSIRARIDKIEPTFAVTRRKGKKAARRLRSAGGVAPEVSTILERVEMDHTKMDVMVVDDVRREPIGRPYLTLAIDDFSRCILGMLVSLEAPSATSVALCLVHAVSEKRAWLERLGLEVDWQMYGKPARLYVDNGADFRGEALRRVSFGLQY
jgi:putative transposase